MHHVNNKIPSIYIFHSCHSSIPIVDFLFSHINSTSTVGVWFTNNEMWEGDSEHNMPMYIRRETEYR